MKKLLLFLLVVYSSCAFAQKSFFGVDAGINVANQRVHIPDGFGTTGGVNYQNSVKLTVGGFYQFGFSEKMGLRLSPRYMVLGYNDQGFVVDINYLTLPLTFHYSIGKHLSFNAGPYLSFTLGGTKIGNQPITSIYHKNDHGLFIGGEYDLYKNFSIAINYVLGLKNVLLDDTIADMNGNTATVNVNNRALQFTLIYKFKKTN